MHEKWKAVGLRTRRKSKGGEKVKGFVISYPNRVR